jgi:hypothetical protein
MTNHDDGPPPDPHVVDQIVEIFYRDGDFPSGAWFAAQGVTKADLEAARVIVDTDRSVRRGMTVDQWQGVIDGATAYVAENPTMTADERHHLASFLRQTADGLQGWLDANRDWGTEAE